MKYIQKLINLTDTIENHITGSIEAVVLVIFDYLHVLSDNFDNLRISLRLFITEYSYHLRVFKNLIDENTASAIYNGRWKLLSFIIVVLIIQIILFLFINFKVFHRVHPKAANSKLLIGISKDFSIKTLYKMYSTAAECVLSNTVYSLIIELESNLGSYLKNEDFYRDIFSNFIKKSSFLMPARKIVKFINWYVTKQKNAVVVEENIFRLMDTVKDSKEFAVTGSVVSGILNNYDSNPYIHDSWRTIAEKLIDRWDNGDISNILLYSGCGSGKTSFIYYLYSLLNGKNLYMHQIIRNETLEQIKPLDLLLTLKMSEIEKMEKKAIILDDVESLLTSGPRGFSQFEKLIVLIEKTKSKILWVSCNRCFYGYIKNIFPVESIFNMKYDFLDITWKEIMEVFNFKLIKSGFRYSVVADKKMKKMIESNIRHKRIDNHGVEQYKSTLFFQRMFTNGKNNFCYSIFNFVKSVKRINDKLILLEQTEPADMEFIDKLGNEAVFILYRIIIHKSLRKEEIAETLLIPLNIVSLNLSLLFENNVIEKNGDSFSISGSVYNHVVKFLQSKNLLG